MGPAFARRTMSASSFIQQQQIIHNHYKKMLPVLSMASLVGGLGWLFLVRAQWSTPQFWLLVSAVGAIAIAAALTIRVNFPINDQLMTWSAAAPPDKMREIWSGWEMAHTVRTILWLGAFALEVVALSVFASQNTTAGGN
ncbi:MAG: hypothetical protein PVS2B2_25680 [Candidatus Acidiferrum sp.]